MSETKSWKPSLLAASDHADAEHFLGTKPCIREAVLFLYLSLTCCQKKLHNPQITWQINIQNKTNKHSFRVGIKIQSMTKKKYFFAVLHPTYLFICLSNSNSSTRPPLSPTGTESHEKNHIPQETPSSVSRRAIGARRAVPRISLRRSDGNPPAKGRWCFFGANMFLLFRGFVCGKQWNNLLDFFWLKKRKAQKSGYEEHRITKERRPRSNLSLVSPQSSTN